MVILDNATGAVRALVGSSNYAIDQVNGAMRPRSCGSTLKPFVYLTAIDRRFAHRGHNSSDTPDAIRDHTAITIPKLNHRYLGPVASGKHSPVR